MPDSLSSMRNTAVSKYEDILDGLIFYSPTKEKNCTLNHYISKETEKSDVH